MVAMPHVWSAFKRAVEMPAQRAEQPGATRVDNRPFEDAILLRLGAAFDEFCSVDPSIFDTRPCGRRLAHQHVGNAIRP